MIYSDRQFKVSTRQLVNLRSGLLDAEQREQQHQWLKQAEVSSIKSQIAELESELAEYKLLQSGQISFSKTYSLEELPRVLVEARIASGISQTGLAKKLNLKPQQIQRYEATDYMGASLGRLIQVSRTLGVRITGAFESPEIPKSSLFSWYDAADISWNQFPYKEMIKRNWLVVNKDENPADKVREYFMRVAGPQFATAFHRKKTRSGHIPNEYALLAWQARILEHYRKFSANNKLPEFDLNDSWIPDLVKLTKLTNGPQKAVDLLARHGIVCVIEPHLTGSYLDGAAMLSDSDTPIIGLTLRYDRLDNFWFVLLHELGHIFLHIFSGLHCDFFDEESESKLDNIEIEADEFALHSLIPNHRWSSCLSRFALTEEAVRIDATSLGVDPSIVAGRIRKERNNYTIFSDLVGQNQVRHQFKSSQSRIHDFD